MQVAPRKIVVLGTGGTIAGTAASAGDDLGYTAAQVGVAQLVEGLGGLEGIAIESEQVAQIDSKDMDHEVWRALAQRCAQRLAQADVAGIVVTHGTDTMEETAWLLHSVLDAHKPVVLTGAMRPATSASADGPGNLADAIRVAATEGMRGVAVAFAGQVFDARSVMKVHASRLDAFGPGDAAPLGRVEQGVFRRTRDDLEAEAGSALRLEKLVACTRWPRVEIVLNHAGASGAIVDGLVQGGVDGIVVAGTGSGTVHHSLEVALIRAQGAGLKVVRSTRCPGGQAISRDDDRLPASPLPPVKARIALLLDLLP
ncbi:asparaginase [Ramlibacter sp.]|uniref:asparaginase n=1 Tax=Ramlibacter sp. TaxID=1917967 RepID=UPI003D0CF5E4